MGLIIKERHRSRVVRATYYGAESRLKIVSSRLDFASDDWKTQPSSKWVPFSNKGRIRQQKDRDESTFYQLCPRYSGTLSPTAIRLRETSTFTLLYFNLDILIQAAKSVKI